jgi:hypothetical protein
MKNPYWDNISYLLTIVSIYTILLLLVHSSHILLFRSCFLCHFLSLAGSIATPAPAAPSLQASYIPYPFRKIKLQGAAEFVLTSSFRTCLGIHGFQAPQESGACDGLRFAFGPKDLTVASFTDRPTKNVHPHATFQGAAMQRGTTAGSFLSLESGPDSKDPFARDRFLEDLGEEIAQLSAHIEAATWRLLRAISEFDRKGGWDLGFTSCAHWLSWRCQWDRVTAREKVRVARALDNLPQINEALQKGRVSYSKVRAMARVATPSNEGELLHIALNGTACHLESVVRGYRRAREGESLEDVQRRHEERALRVYTDANGMVVIQARLTPEVGAVVKKALEAAMEQIRQGDRDKEKIESFEAVPGKERQQIEPNRKAKAEGCRIDGEEKTAAEPVAILNRDSRLRAVPVGLMEDKDEGEWVLLEKPERDDFPLPFHRAKTSQPSEEALAGHSADFSSSAPASKNSSRHEKNHP